MTAISAVAIALCNKMAFVREGKRLTLCSRFIVKMTWATLSHANSKLIMSRHHRISPK